MKTTLTIINDEPLTEHEIWIRCARADWRYCERNGWGCDQSSEISSYFESPTVFVLRNGYRELARYRMIEKYEAKMPEVYGDSAFQGRLARVKAAMLALQTYLDDPNDDPSDAAAAGGTVAA